jgi:hypothetical protein
MLDGKRWFELQVLIDGDVYVAVDASDWGWGTVLMSKEGAVLEVMSQRWANAAACHIFIREVIALCRCVERLLSSRL